MKQSRKRYVKGRLLNLTRGGYCIGIFGFIGFLPNSHTFLKISKSIGVKNNFYIIKIDNNKKSFIISQRHMDKIFKRRLLKLGSRLTYLKKFNYFGEYNSIFLVRVLDCDSKSL